MHPVLFRIGSFPIALYGVMIAVGMIIAVFLVLRLARRVGIKDEAVIDIVFYSVIAGMIGARILYIIVNFEDFVNHPLFYIFNRQGFVLWGAILGASPVVYYMIKKKGLALNISLDLAAVGLILAQAFGRIGCFFNGCCYGIEAPAGFPLGLALPHDALRHPAQLYSASLLFAIFVILRVWQDKKRFDGEIFLGYCMLYSVKRFSVEFLRGDNPRILLGLTLSQVISVFLLAVALLLFISRYRRWKKKISTGSK